MEVPLSWERLLWSRRGLLPPWERYVLTDFRLVRLGRHQSDELAIQDIADVQHREAWIDRILGSSTVVVHSRNHRRAPLVLPHVRHGAQLAALLDLTSAEPTVRWDQQSVRAALKWNPRTPVAGYREAALSVAHDARSRCSSSPSACTAKRPPSSIRATMRFIRMGRRRIGRRSSGSWRPTSCRGRAWRSVRSKADPTT